MACCYAELGQTKEALRLFREVYAIKVQRNGNDTEDTLREAGNVVECLLKMNKIGEAEDLLNDVMPVAKRSLGTDHRWTLVLRNFYGKLKADASGVEILEDTVRRASRVLGPDHPDTQDFQETLDAAGEKLAALDSS